MAGSWHSVVDMDLSRVDEVMRTEVRSAYPELNRMCEDTLNSRYHSVRPALSILSYYANGGKDHSLAVNSAACFESVFEGLHLHDMVDSEGDVIAPKKKFLSKAPSTTKVVVAGDFMYVMGFRLAYGKVPKVVPYLMKVSSSISDAIFKIVDNEHNPDVTEEACICILKGKGAVEYQIIMEYAAKQAGSDDVTASKMSECGMYIGMALQIESDLEDLSDNRGSTFKRGFPTMPIFYSMQDPELGPKIREIFSNTRLGQKEVDSAVKMIFKTGAPEKCRRIIKENMDKASAILSEVLDSPYKSALIEFTKVMR